MNDDDSPEQAGLDDTAALFREDVGLQVLTLLMFLAFAVTMARLAEAPVTPPEQAAASPKQTLEMLFSIIFGLQVCGLLVTLTYGRSVVALAYAFCYAAFTFGGLTSFCTRAVEGGYGLAATVFFSAFTLFFLGMGAVNGELARLRSMNRQLLLAPRLPRLSTWEAVAFWSWCAYAGLLLGAAITAESGLPDLTRPGSGRAYAIVLVLICGLSAGYAATDSLSRALYVLGYAGVTLVAAEIYVLQIYGRDLLVLARHLGAAALVLAFLAVWGMIGNALRSDGGEW
jgi:hypothetical protein